MKQKDYDRLPSIVKEYFEGFVRLRGVRYLRYIGSRSGSDFYCYSITDGSENGFPSVVALKDGILTKYLGFDALRVLNSFCGED